MVLINIRKSVFLMIPLFAFFLSACESKRSEKEKQGAVTEGVNQTMKTERTTPAERIVDLFDAALNGQMDVVKNAMEQTGDVDTVNENGHTPLMLAAYNGHTAIVKLLLEKGANVNLKDPEGRSPLMFAASGPFAETVKLLLEHGADVNLADNGEHFTPLMYAAAEGQLDVVKVLLEYGADISMKDVDGDTATSFARKNGHTKVAELIEQFGK